MKEELKFSNLTQFMTLVQILKTKVRTGWTNWETTCKNPETIAAHSWSAGLIAFSMYSEFNYDIDISKVMIMLAIHDLPESLIPDFTPFSNVSLDEKSDLENESMSKLSNLLNKGCILKDLFTEFNEKKTNESIFANLCDKLDADFNSKFYQDNGFFKNLSEINNDFTSNPKIQSLIKNGAETVFDVWYEYDKKYYQNDDNFYRMLEFLKTFDMNVS